MSSSKDELVPFLIAALHAQRVQCFIESYRSRNGKTPTKAKIDEFISMVIASGAVPKEAQEIADELYKKFIKSTKRKRVIFDFSIGSPIAAALIIFVYILFSQKIPEEILDNALTLAIPCIIVIFVVIFGMVLQYFHDSKN